MRILATLLNICGAFSVAYAFNEHVFWLLVTGALFLNTAGFVWGCAGRRPKQ
ncbi:MAG: hypothetical protein IMZ62_12845 [Chloroflexi bacterium]|nr:hypothetical protein [Chloroflexota bacterium]MBE3119091.1 hypothetical protein [Candidatus Atribacteria bacterium]